MSRCKRIKNIEKRFMKPAEQEPIFKKYRISSKRCIISQAGKLPVYTTEKLIQEAIKLRDPDYKKVTMLEIMAESDEVLQEAQERYDEAIRNKATQTSKKRVAPAPVKSEFVTDAENDFMELCFDANEKGWNSIREKGSSLDAQIAYDTHTKNLPYFDYEKMIIKEFLSI